MTDKSRHVYLESGQHAPHRRQPNRGRAYLCVAGGFASPIVLSSRSALEPLVRDWCCPARRVVPRAVFFTSTDRKLDSATNATSAALLARAASRLVSSA